MDATDTSASGPTYTNMVNLHNLGIKVLLIFDYNFADSTLGVWQADVHTALVNYGTLPDAIECWNEPDWDPFQRGFMNGSAQVYVNALIAVHTEMVSAGVTVPLIAGAIADLWGDANVTGGNLLAAIRGLGSDSYADVYSYHSYSWTIQHNTGGYNAATYYNQVKAVAGSKPLWITEMGEDTVTPVYMANWFTQLEGVSCPFITWYHFSDSSDSGYAMITTGFSIRQQYTIFQTFATSTTPPQLYYNLLMAKSGTGSGTTNPTLGIHSEFATSNVSCYAYPTMGSMFSYWLLNGTNVGSNNPYNLNITGNFNMTAIFAIGPLWNLHMQVAGVGSGTTSPTAGDYTYANNTLVSAHAYPASNSLFWEWLLNSSYASSSSTYYLYMTDDYNLTAVFNLTVTISGIFEYNTHDATNVTDFVFGFGNQTYDMTNMQTSANVSTVNNLAEDGEPVASTPMGTQQQTGFIYLWSHDFASFTWNSNTTQLLWTGNSTGSNNTASTVKNDWFVQNTQATGTAPTGSQSQKGSIYVWSSDFYFGWQRNGTLWSWLGNSTGSNNTANVDSHNALVPWVENIVTVTVASTDGVGSPLPGITFTITDISQSLTYSYATPQTIYLPAGDYVFWTSSDTGGPSFTAFNHWILNGTASSTTQYMTLTLNGPTSLTAVYGTGAITISGGGYNPFLVPMPFILWIIGLLCMFAGPMYFIHKSKQKEYMPGFTTGLVVTALGFGLFIAGLWGVNV